MRMRLIIAVVTSLYANAAPPGGPAPLGTDDIDEQLARLISFFAPGLAAPSPLAATAAGLAKDGRP
jgi:hypothetical protein